MNTFTRKTEREREKEKRERERESKESERMIHKIVRPTKKKSEGI